MTDSASSSASCRTYALRHFFASDCLAMGIPITDVAEWMGHRNINMTL